MIKETKPEPYFFLKNFMSRIGIKRHKHQYYTLGFSIYFFITVFAITQINDTIYKKVMYLIINFFVHLYNWKIATLILNKSQKIEVKLSMAIIATLLLPMVFGNTITHTIRLGFFMISYFPNNIPNPIVHILIEISSYIYE